jgi:hypothetical protein
MQTVYPVSNHFHDYFWGKVFSLNPVVLYLAEAWSMAANPCGAD